MCCPNQPPWRCRLLFAFAVVLLYSLAIADDSVYRAVMEENKVRTLTHPPTTVTTTTTTTTISTTCE